MKKRILSVLLAIVMVVGMMPGFTLTAHASFNGPLSATRGLYTLTITDYTARFNSTGNVASSGNDTNLLSINNIYLDSSGKIVCVYQLGYTQTGGYESWHVFTFKVIVENVDCTQSLSSNITATYEGNTLTYTTKGTLTRAAQTSHTGGTATCIAAPTCIVCGKTYGSADTINGHSWGEWKSNDNGTHTRTCTLSSEHKETDACDGKATCTEDAVCSKCGTTHKTATDHSLTYTVSDNVITETCSNDCNHSATATLTATDQTYTGSAITAAIITYFDNWAGSNKPTEINYTDNVNVGTATATITVEGQTLSTTFQITAASIADATVTLNPAAGTYTGTAYAPAISVVYNGITLAEDTDYTVSWDKTDLTDEGTYTATVTGKGNFSGTTSKEFTVNAASLSDITVAQDGTLTYTGEAQTPTVSANATAVNGESVTFTYLYEDEESEDDDDGRGESYGNLPQFTEAGTYTVKYKASAPNHKASYGEFTVTVDKATVTEPTIASKIYTGSAQTADIVDTDLYTVQNNGGTASGSYYVVLKLKDANNYKWTTTDNANVTLQFKITTREITITAENKETIVNTELPTYTYKVEGLVGEDKLVTEPTLTCSADITAIGEYDITVSNADAGGNYSIQYVPAKLTIRNDIAVDAAADYTEELKDYDPANVTSEDKARLEEILEKTNTFLADEATTDNGKEALEAVKEQVEALIKEITDAAEAVDTENTEKVEDVTAENVTPEDKTDLENAKADLEKALEDYGDNYTDDEKKAIEDELGRIDDALDAIENVENVEELIDKLPETITKADEAAIKAADDAYNALTNHEKSLVDEDAKKTLDDAKAALAKLNKSANSTSPNTGDNSSLWLWFALLFVSGAGLFGIIVYDRKRKAASKR